jgi:hypothetical protein
MKAMDRIFTACHGTQLLVIQHLRRHLQLPPAREFLIWHPLDSNPSLDRFMRPIVSEAGFDGVLDIGDIESLRPRTQGSLGWWFESARRLRCDAGALHGWMAANAIDEAAVELWADEPTHLNVILSRGTLHRSVQVKIPHCFNFEDAMTPHLVSNFEATWRNAPWAKKHIYFPWLRLSAQVDMRLDRIAYDRAYTFAMPSPWSANSVDVSKLISIDAFADTYRGLPSAMRAEVDAVVAPIRAGAKPLLLLLLFGLGSDDTSRTLYQKTMLRIFSEHAAELQGGSLAVKWHPAASGEQERILVEWLTKNVPAQVYEICHPLNLEFLLPQLKPDYVMAGLCGSLPIVRDLRAGRAIILAEFLDFYLAQTPTAQQWVPQFLQGIEVW